MADQKPDAEDELDDNGNPIKPGDEDGGKPSKITSKTDDDGEADPGKDNAEDEDDIQVPVRKSSLQHIIARKNRTIDKLKSKAGDDVDTDDEDANDGVGDEDDDDKESLTPEARGAVQKEVARAIGPVVKTLVSQADEDELNRVLEEEPGAKNYEKRIRAYMNHPSYKGVPPAVIYHHLAFDDAEGTGARRKKAADHEAGQGKGGGRTPQAKDVSTNGIPSAEELDEMTDEEFEQLQNRARSGEFVKPAE